MTRLFVSIDFCSVFVRIFQGHRVMHVFRMKQTGDVACSRLLFRM